MLMLMNAWMMLVLMKSSVKCMLNTRVLHSFCWLGPPRPSWYVFLASRVTGYQYADNRIPRNHILERVATFKNNDIFLEMIRLFRHIKIEDISRSDQSF